MIRKYKIIIYNITNNICFTNYNLSILFLLDQ